MTESQPPESTDESNPAAVAGKNGENEARDGGDAPGENASDSAEATGEDATPSAAVAVELARLEAEVELRAGAVRALRPLAKPDAYTDLKKLRGRIEKLETTLGPERVDLCRLAPVIAELKAFQEAAGQRRRKEVGRQLKAACQAVGLELRVVSREDPVELRIPPLAVVLDFDKGVAELRFARQPLLECGATAADILDGYERALAALETPFDAAGFFSDCLTAYHMSLVALGRKRGERVEINDFLANLAVRRQSKKFHEDPVASHFRGYSRAQFAYDVLRLRKVGGLTQSGRRINFGVATGTTATKKSRVLYMEDGEGKGEYKLTVYFNEAGA